MKGDLEKKIFITFFIVSFTLILILTLFGWYLVRFIINQHEDKQINSRITLLQNKISSYTIERVTLVNNLALDQNLINLLSNPNRQLLTRYFRDSATQFNGHFIIYDNEQRLVFGEQIINLEKYLPAFSDLEIKTPNYFFIDLGRSNYHVSYNIIDKERTSQATITPAILFYLEEFVIQRLDTTYEFPYFQITQTDYIDYLTLTPEFRNLTNEMKRLLVRSSDSQNDTDIIRLSIEYAMGLIIGYDIHRNASMFILIPFVRDFNSFAHTGLLVFVLLLLAMALIMISIGGAWFSKQIITPVKDVSTKMRDIEQNPSYLEPLPKKYHGVLGSMIDTFNSMNESLLRYSKSLMEYKTIINNLDSGVLWMDGDFNIILCNPRILEIFEVEAFQDIIGKNLQDFINISEESLEKARNRELFIPHLEIYHRDIQKIIKFVIFNVREVDDQAGLRYVTSITDITRETKESKARERLEIELIKSNRLADLGRLVEGVVHNINSPLNTMVGYAQLIKKEHPENKDVDKIISAGNSIANSVKQLMTKVKEDSISMMRMIDINDVVRQELDICQHNIFFSQSVKLITDLLPIDKKVNASHGEISLCVANLINNAIQAMEKREKRELIVRTRLDDKMIAIEVCDTGEGIPEENLGKLFSPEFSTKSAKEGEGFGLGLPISKIIAEKYHGYITVQSIVDEGSSFTLFLPWYS